MNDILPFHRATPARLIDRNLLAAVILGEGLRKVQEYVLDFDMGGTVLDPAYILREFQEGFAQAADLAKELADRNFMVEEIEQQEEAIRAELGPPAEEIAEECGFLDGIEWARSQVEPLVSALDEAVRSGDTEEVSAIRDEFWGLLDYLGDEDCDPDVAEDDETLQTGRRSPEVDERMRAYADPERGKGFIADRLHDLVCALDEALDGHDEEAIHEVRHDLDLLRGWCDWSDMLPLREPNGSNGKPAGPGPADDMHAQANEHGDERAGHDQTSQRRADR